LALAYSAGELREPFAALLQLDWILGRSVALAREPVLGQVRLAWWREQLAALPSVPTGNDPLLGALHGLLRNHRLNQGDLAGLVNGWETLLDEFPLSDSQLIVRARGGRAGRFSVWLLPFLLRPPPRRRNAPERDAAAGLDRLTPAGSPRGIVQALAFVAGLP
jgi:phytoene synthase